MRVILIGVAMAFGVLLGWSIGGLGGFFVVLAMARDHATAYSAALLLGVLGAAGGAALGAWVATRLTRRSAEG